MGGAEGVVDVDFGELGQLAAELGIVGFLTRIKAQVLQQQDVAVRQRGHLCLHLGPDAVVGHGDGATEELGQVGSHRGEAVLRVRFSLGATEMRGQDQPAALGQDVADGRQGGDDAGVVGDLLLIVEGDVEVDPTENSFTLEREIFDGDLVEHGDASGDDETDAGNGSGPASRQMKRAGRIGLPGWMAGINVRQCSEPGRRPGWSNPIRCRTRRGP